MKIVQVVAGKGEGGLERHVLTLSGELAKRHEVLLIAHPSFNAPAGVHIAPLDLERSRWNPRLLWDVLRTVRRFMPDIVHVHANKAAAIVSHLCPFIPCRTVATLHNRKSSTRMFGSFDAVIAVSHGAAQSLRRRDVHIIHNGVASQEIAPETVADLKKQLKLQPDKPVFAAIGRFVKAKGFDLLLTAWREIPASLLLVGDGPERSTLEKLANGLPVQFLGWRKDVPSIIRAVDGVIISSRREGFPLLASEVLRAHQLLISTRVQGIEDILPSALLVPPDDPLALHNAITTALNDLQATRERCAPAWRYADAELTIERMTARVEQVYATLGK